MGGSKRVRFVDAVDFREILRRGEPCPEYLAEHVDDRIDRRVKNGAKDRGDNAGLRHMGHRVVIECKNEAKVNLGKDPATGVTLFQSQNVASARIYGAELTATGRLGEWLPRLEGWTARLSAPWEAAIYPDHGWGGKEGQVTGRLFRKKYEFARDEGRAVLEEALAGIAGRVGARPEKGLRLVVFNSLSWARSDTAAALVTPGSRDFRLVDASGEEILYQRLPQEGPAAPGAVLIEFVARDVPALGYKTFHLVEGSKPVLR